MSKKNYFVKENKLIHETENKNIDKLFDLYREDKYKARVIYMNNTTGYERQELVLFKEENGDFSLVLFRKKFGISTTNRIWKSEKREVTISYKHEDEKFWLITRFGGKMVTQLTLSLLRNRLDHFMFERVLKVLSSRFSWLNYIKEKDILYDMSLNKIIKEKLFSFKKALQYTYDMPYPVAKMCHEHKGTYLIENIIHYKKWYYNIESLREDWVSNSTLRDIFHDTLRMGKILDKKVNCSWSDNRLRNEHDKWSNEITDIIFIDDNKIMSIDDVFLDFQKQSGFKLITDTKDMIREGKRLMHCVATYIKKVEGGNCAIFTFGEYTLELVKGYSDGKKSLLIGQLKGFKNSAPPEDLSLKVLEEVIRYNEEKLGVVLSVESVKRSNIFQAPPIMEMEIIADDDLPF